MPPYGAALGTVASSFRLPQEIMERYRILVRNIKLEQVHQPGRRACRLSQGWERHREGD